MIADRMKSVNVQRKISFRFSKERKQNLTLSVPGSFRFELAKIVRSLSESSE